MAFTTPTGRAYISPMVARKKPSKPPEHPPLGTNSCGSALMSCQSAMNAMKFENKASKHCWPRAPVDRPERPRADAPLGIAGVYVIRFGKSDANRIEAWSSASDRRAASLMCSNGLLDQQSPTLVRYRLRP